MSSIRVARLSVGTLLHAQDRAEALVAKAVEEEASRAAAELARKKAEERRRRASVLGVLLLSGKRLAESAAKAIERGRTLARESAAVRLTAELVALGVDPAPIGRAVSRPLVAASRRERASEDELHAKAAAESLATQWRGVALATALAAVSREDDPGPAIGKSAALVRGRVVRTANTEVSLAYNDEHADALADAVRYDSDFADALEMARVVQEWSALADACEHCWPHDGERAPIGENFAGGAMPGEMHPRCRCIAFLTTEYVEARRAA